MEVEPNYLRVINPPQSPNDKRIYKLVELQNKLKVLMISDPSLQKSACAISVGVGSTCDTDRSLGLAHFLEHMLFMGSENYPQHNQYSSFISNHGGMDNAYTQMQETNYFFQIANEQFAEGVKRLADFFRKPILNPDCIEKERQAVHQQYQLWTSDDNTRKWEIIHALAEGKYARFSIGNQDTLNHQHILTDLRQYYNRTYSANIINAVLISNLEISQQQKLLTPLANIENKNYEKEKLPKPFPPHKLGKLIKVQSIKDEYIMEFVFVLDNLKPLYRKHIGDYLTFVLGHESEGSLSAYLQSQGYISQLMAFDHHIPEATIVGIQLTLTQPGTGEYKKIYEIVMQYISQLKPEQYIYNDIKQRAQLNWQFLQKTGSSSYSSKLASKLHHVQPQHVLDYKIQFDHFDSQLIAKYLKDLDENHLLLFLSSVNPIKGSVAEPYLGAKYKVQNILDFSKKDIPQFNFLKPNKFFPVSTKLQTQAYETPKKLTPNVTLFKKNDVCKGGLTLHVYSDIDKVFMQLFQHWVSMMLKQSTYDASMLDSNMQFSSDRSLWINLFGYNEVVLKLINIIGQQIHHVLLKDRQKSQIMFEIVRERMLQEYQNEYLDETDSVLSNEFSRICNAKTEATIQQTIKILSKMTMKQFADKVSTFWKNVSLQWIVVGNFDEEEIIQTVHNFQKGIIRNLDAIKQQPCLKLTQDFHFTIKIPSPQISTSGALVYYEFDRNVFRNKLILELLAIFIKEPFFDELRTSKQLGYIAQTSSNLNGGITGLKFTVVSSTADPFALHKEITTFVESHFSTLNNLTQEKLLQMKEAIIVKQCEPFKNLQQQYEFIVTQIITRTYQFNRRNKEAVQQQLDTIQISDLQNAAKKLLEHNLSIEAVANSHKKDYEKNKVKAKKFDDIRKKSEYHPDYENPRPHIV